MCIITFIFCPLSPSFHDLLILFFLFNLSVKIWRVCCIYLHYGTNYNYIYKLFVIIDCKLWEWFCIDKPTIIPFLTTLILVCSVQNSMTQERKALTNFGNANMLTERYYLLYMHLMQKMHKKVDPIDHYRSYLHFLRRLLLRQEHWVLAWPHSEDHICVRRIKTTVRTNRSWVNCQLAVTVIPVSWCTLYKFPLQANGHQ